CGGALHRDTRRIRRLARYPRDRRLRSQDLRGPRLSRRCRRPAAPRHERLRRLGETLMQARVEPGFLSVALRELEWLRHDVVALALVLVIPLFAITVLSLTFSNAVIRDLRVDVVDQDQTRTSLTYVQAINAAPGVNVTLRSTDLNGAMHAVRS